MRTGKRRSSPCGMSLVELLVALGLSGVVALVVGQVLTNNQSQVKRLNRSLAILEFKSSLSGYFLGKIGGSVLRSWKPSFTPPTTWPSQEALTQVQYPSFDPSALQCLQSGSALSGLSTQKIPVDLLMVGTPVAVRGLSLPGQPELKVEELFLTQLGRSDSSAGSGVTCPAQEACRKDEGCLFRLFVRIGIGSVSGSQGGSQEFSLPLWCQTEKDPDSSSEMVRSCRLPSILEQEALTCDRAEFDELYSASDPLADRNKDGGVSEADIVAFEQQCKASCAGDVNQDSVVDDLDIAYIEAFMGTPLNPIMDSMGMTKTSVAETDYLGLSYSGLVDSAKEAGSIEWLARGDYPEPVPDPWYSYEFINSIASAYKRADLDRSGVVDAGDIGLVLLDFGCVSRPQVCLNKTEVYQLVQRAKGFGVPENVLDDQDLDALQSCAETPVFRLKTIEERQKCLAMNLDGRCALLDEVPGPTDPPVRACSKNGNPINGAGVVDEGDLRILRHLIEFKRRLDNPNAKNRYQTQTQQGSPCEATTL